MRTLTQAYFSPERPLHLSFTHLVCRSAIEGNHQRTPLAPPIFTAESPPLASLGAGSISAYLSPQELRASGWGEPRGPVVGTLIHSLDPFIS